MSEHIIRANEKDGRWHYVELMEEIVRCGDCKHHELQTVSHSDKPLSVCTAEWCEGSEHDNPLVEPYGFCAWGERKERIES